MKRLIFLLIPLMFQCQIGFSAPCYVKTTAINIKSTTLMPDGKCRIRYTLTIDMETNAGNKWIYWHIWKNTQYPNHDYSHTSYDPVGADLVDALATIVINNNVVPAKIGSTYFPDPTVPVKDMTSNPDITLTVVPNDTAATPSDYYILDNLFVDVAGGCDQPIILTGDVWSSNSAGTGKNIHCASPGIRVSVNDAFVSGVCESPSPGGFIDFAIATSTMPGLHIYYDVFIDSPNVNIQDTGRLNKWDPKDPLMYSLPEASAFLITPTTPFASGSFAIPPTWDIAYWSGRKIFVRNHSLEFPLETTQGTIDPCGPPHHDYGDLPTSGSLPTPPATVWPSARAKVVGTLNGDSIIDNTKMENTVAVWAGLHVSTNIGFPYCADGKNALADCDAYDDGLTTPVEPQPWSGHTYPYSIKLNGNTAGMPVYYGLWFDWNNNGSFVDAGDAFYSDTTTITLATIRTLTRMVPSPITPGPFKIRLIVSGNPVTADLSGATVINGEVEDYAMFLNDANLPVQFGDLSITTVNCKTLVKFSTLTEKNNRSFGLEQSNDGKNWREVASLESQGVGAHQYEIMDDAPVNGSNFYRIRQLDYSMESTFSPVLHIKNNCYADDGVKTFPNPVDNNLTLAVPDEMKYGEATIVDIMGRTIIKAAMNGQKIRTISTPDLPSGMYDLRINYGNNQTFRKSIVKQ